MPSFRDRYTALQNAKTLQKDLSQANAVVEITQKSIYVICDLRGIEDLDWVRAKYPKFSFESNGTVLTVEIPSESSPAVLEKVISTGFYLSRVVFAVLLSRFIAIKLNAF